MKNLHPTAFHLFSSLTPSLALYLLKPSIFLFPEPYQQTDFYEITETKTCSMIEQYAL
uniref:Uncharacterized protein n=1 Tax=Setaria italica TaxID=4555 RepID=K4ANW0_SETIT